jgi:hypothetical protein
MKFKILLSAFLVFNVFLSKAQIFDLEQHPAYLNWNKIKSPHFDIVFPDSLTREAQRVANLMEYLYRPVSQSLRDSMKRWPLILNATYADANGYVALAPKKSEWYPSAPQTNLLGSGEWYQLLATHETRHIAQFDKLNHGVTKLFWLFGGEFGRLGYSSLAVPSWFWEGDAVCTETALSSTGRGRLPAFERDIRLLTLSDQKLTYFNSYLGSLKNYFPDHYRLGYVMNSYIRRKYGVEILDKTLRNVTRFSTYGHSLKKYTGANTFKTFKLAISELDSLWNAQLKNIDVMPVKNLAIPNKKVWTNYLYPQYLNDSDIIALKTGLNNFYDLVKIKQSGFEQTLFCVYTNEPISVNGNKISWSETKSDIRYGNASKSIVWVYDCASKKKILVKNDQSLYSPALSADGNKVVAVQLNPDRAYELVLFDIKKQQKTSLLKVAAPEILGTPSWSGDGLHVVFTRQGLYGKSIEMINCANLNTRVLIDKTFTDITSPRLWNDYLIYNSTATGIDNLFALNLKNSKQYQVTSRIYGTYDAGINEQTKKIVFTDYKDAKGSVISETDLDTAAWKLLSAPIPSLSLNLHEKLVDQEFKTSLLVPSKYPQVDYPVSKYWAPHKFINIHSWHVIPFPEYIGFNVQSTNLLNTFSLSYSGNYFTNEKVFQHLAELTFSKYFPLFQLGLVRNGRVQNISHNGEVTAYKWFETGAKAGVALPFSFSQGNLYSQLIVGYNFNKTKVTEKFYPIDWDQNNGYLNYNHAYINFTHLFYAPKRSVKSHGLTLNAQFFTTKSMLSDYRGDLLSINLRTYLRGITRNHSLNFNFAYEKQNPISYRFQSYIRFSRGYEYSYFDEVRKFEANYEFPICYPDLSLLRIAFLRRIKGNVFFDYSGVKNKGTKVYQFNSTGGELIFDTNLFNILGADMQIGPRFSYLTAKKKWITQFVIFAMNF